MTILTVACLLLLLVQATSVQGSCYMERPYFDEATGSTYCMADDSVRLEVDEWYVTSSCYNCSCGETSMSCCGVGVQAGVADAPPDSNLESIPPCGFRLVEETK